jgi:protoporphyrinogen oxidase
MKIAILGAGLAGLELGRKLRGLGENFTILEKESQVGGLCRTNKTGDYYWDFAVHAMYSRNKEAMDYFHSLPIEYEHKDRNVKIFHTGSDGRKYILDYPFEMGVKDLPFRHKIECIRGYLAVRARGTKPYSNLEEWISSHLGAGMAKHFMIPYNNKIWNSELTKISERLVSSKIEPAPVIGFLMSAFGKEVVGRAYQAKFIYPKKGVQELMDHTAKGLRDRISLNASVEKLVRSNSGWTVVASGGIREEADVVVSTMPLVELLKKVDVDGLEKEYDVFKWNNTFFVMVGLKRGYDFQMIKNCHWVFFKESEVFYRGTLMHNFSSEFPPTFVAEITQKGDVVGKSEDEIKNLVTADLVRLGIVGSLDQIAETDIKLVEHTYPIPTVGLEEVKAKVRETLEKQGIYLVGRNGNWDYINMDGVILDVREFVTEKLIPSMR